MRARSVGDVIAMIAVVAGIMMLTHPGTGGPGLIDALTSTFTNAAGNTIYPTLSGGNPNNPNSPSGGAAGGGSVPFGPGLAGGVPTPQNPSGGAAGGGNTPFGPGLPG